MSSEVQRLSNHKFPTTALPAELTPVGQLSLLPEDILRDILVYGFYAEEDPHLHSRHSYLRGILSISQYFRAVARDTTSLWSVICVQSGVPKHFYESCLALSKSRPIYVALISDRMEEYASVRGNFELFIPYATRWRSLNLQCPPSFFDMEPPFMIITTTTHWLQRLTLDMGGIPSYLTNRIFEMLSITALAYLELHGLLGWPVLAPKTLPNLRFLSISGAKFYHRIIGEISFDSVIAFAAGLEKLEVLNLVDIRAPEIASTIPSVVQLPTLRNLRLLFRGTTEMFSFFEAPLLETLTIDGRYGLSIPDAVLQRPSAYAPQRAAFPLLRKIVIDFVRRALDVSATPLGATIEKYADLSEQFTEVVLLDAPWSVLLKYFSDPLGESWVLIGARSFTFIRSAVPEMQEVDFEEPLRAFVHARQREHMIVDGRGLLPASIKSLSLINFLLPAELRAELRASLEVFREPVGIPIHLSAEFGAK